MDLSLSSRALCATLAIGLAWPNAMAASCVPRPQDRGDLPRFQADTSFDVQVRATDRGADIRVTGDVILIDETTLSSIVAEPSKAKTKVARLTFDGRLIRVAGPISLVDTRLNLIGDTVRFEKNGRISLQPGSTQQERSVRIVARAVEFDGGAKRPINLNLSSDPRVKSEIVMESGIASPNQAWALHVDALEADEPPQERTAFKIGNSAAQTVAQVYKSESEWPLFFAAKLRKHFERSPYAEATREEVGAIANAYEEKIATWRDPKPFAILKSIQTAIRNGSNTAGKARSFTPKEDLIAQKKHLAELMEKNQFDALAEIIASTGNDSPAKKAALDSIRKQISANAQDLKVKQLEIDRLHSKLQRLAQNMNASDTRIDQRRLDLELMRQRDFERLKDAQSVKQWTTVASAAVVIAASMGAATPAVAAGAAAGLGATGETIYSHNAGSPFTLAEVIAAGAKSYEAAQKFQGAWGKFQEAGKLRSDVYSGKEIPKGAKPAEGPDQRKPWTKTEATVDYVGALASAVQAAAAMTSGGVAGPTPMTLTERENTDEEMKALLTKRAAEQQESSLVAAQIGTDTGKLDAIVTKGIELEEIDNSLRTAVAKNDQEAARWNASALALWQAEVGRISTAVMTYKRSLYFEAGAVPAGVPEALDYPNELQSQMAAGILDPFGGVGPLATSQELQTRLGHQKAIFMTSAQANYAATVDAYRSYLDSRNEADVYRRVFEIKADSTDVVKRRFIQAINGQITQQIVGGTSVQALLPAYIPIELPTPVSNYPERLIGATIVGVKFNVPAKNIGVGALDFVLIHPGYGEMRREGECFAADFRQNPTDWKRFTTTFEQVNSDWISKKPTKVEISETKSDRYYTFLPARAPYHLLLNVVSKNWVTLPKVESIQIGLEIMQ